MPAGCVALFTTRVHSCPPLHIFICVNMQFISKCLLKPFTVFFFFNITSPTVLQWRTCVGNWLTSCWCWMERQGMCGCLLVDQWDWEAPSEAPPQESPRSDTALYSSSPCGGQEILSMTSFKTLWFREPIMSRYNIEIFLAIKKKKKKRKIKYLFFADVLVGLIFKPLLNASKRHVPIIFGNILTETEGRERAKGKRRKEKNKWLSLIHFAYCISIIKGTNRITCPFENYSLSIQCSPIKVTHPEARFCDSDSLMTTHPPALDIQPKCLPQSFMTLPHSLGFRFALKP